NSDFHHNRQNSQDSRVAPAQAIQSDQLSPARNCAPPPTCERINQPPWRCKALTQLRLPASKPPPTTISQGSLTITTNSAGPAAPANLAATPRTPSIPPVTWPPSTPSPRPDISGLVPPIPSRSYRPRSATSPRGATSP
ncbi:hypothetical protein B0T18DRAFT_230938, partial [Schizothecium vesticola]